MRESPEDEARARASRVRLMVFDVDGVLTDGSLYYDSSGVEIKVFNVRDGHGLKMLKESGVRVAILSARRSRSVDARAAELGIELVRQGAADKGAAFAHLLAEQDVPAGSAGYMGDDLPDLPVLVSCGFAASVPEAPEAVRARVHYITRAGGGRGAAREVCDLIMNSQDSLERAIARQLA